jgi:glycosyltransferase involved in cell wall biosynthesis
MYSSTTSGLPVTSGLLPTILQPTAHDEPALWVRNYDTMFRLADAFMFFTPEERRLVSERFKFEPEGPIIGMGLEVHERADPAPFRQQVGLGTDPYLLYVGRIEPAKGALEAYRFFEAFKARNPGSLKFVFVGDKLVDFPDHPDVMHAGFLDESTKRAALAGCFALFQPSYFESFSIVLCEAWLQGRPALVQGRSEVLAGQARRAMGALPYRGFAEFEAALNFLLDNPALADRMGDNGRRYVEKSYTWENVIDEVESAVELATGIYRDRA